MPRTVRDSTLVRKVAAETGVAYMEAKNNLFALGLI